ncbi:MAG: glycosyltransferase [Candidatus Woesearchaeota archaeon]
MRIVYASQSFFPHIGGVSTYLLNLAKKMSEQGNEVVEVHLRPAGEQSQAEVEGIKVVRVPKQPINKQVMLGYSRFKESVYTECHYHKQEFFRPIHEMDGFLEFSKVNEYFGEEIRDLLQENPPDIVHIHDFQLLYTYKYVPRGTALILTWHIPFTQSMSRYLSNFLVKNLVQYDRVVFSSPDYIEAAVKAGFPREKAELIHPICNTELFRKIDVGPETRQKYGLPNGKIILCVQRVDPKSGHEQLIRAMPKVLKAVPNAFLVFVGGESMSNKLSPDRAVLQKHIRQLVKELKLAKKVLFLGNIDYHVLPEVYNCVDVVALCSKNEGFGLSVTEGMACGNPIVGTKVGGIPLQVQDGHNGFLVDVGDVDATGDRLARILADSELREQLSRNALDVVQKRFRLEEGIEKHAAMYNKLRKDKDELHKIEFINLLDLRAFVTDLDRTITDGPAKPDFDSADFDASLFAELKSLNVDLVLATGRTFNYVRRFCRNFPVWKCAVSENGCVLYFPRTNQTITLTTGHMSRARRILRQLNIPGMSFGNIDVSVPITEEQTVLSRLGKLVDKLSFAKNVDTLMVLPKGVDKGVGVRLALRYLNIDAEKSVIMGDAENDVAMFLCPGFKVAVANATANLKKLANHVTTNPGTRGVREVIEELRAKHDTET